MEVNLWGYVRNPGRYEVPISTDLVELLSFAGGPTQGASLDDVKIVRGIRGGSTIRKVEFRINLDRMERLDDKALDLEPGDTVLMEGGEWAVRDVITVLSTAAVITAAVASLINATRRY
jgi:NADH:ubiquinone oxidoreductase subunit F (NADH-binding)